jgi:16S rRNA (adenine1518-N6/adenine1519-N6)-dimethyltransferase
MSPEKLGQHFLADASWREQISDAIAIDHGLWLEIGAGHGEMTSRLAERAAKVIAVELDRTLAPRLRQSVAGMKNVEVVEGDVLAIDLETLTHGARFSVYGNLPYYITSPILHRLFERAEQIDAIHIVIQHEVALRIVSPPGRRDYGYLSVAAQWFGKPELVLRIPPGAFDPPPKVESALVSMYLPGERANIKIADEQKFLDFIKECFSHKRKTLRNNLRDRLTSRADAVLQDAHIPAGARAEQLTIPQFAELFQVVEQASE